MAHVEKDFWVTEVLRGVAHHSNATGVSAVFKGGTSLSKAFRLIQRFSEDVDLLVIVPGSSTGADSRCLKGFVAAAEESTGLDACLDTRTATKGVKRAVTLSYPTELERGPLRSGVLLELGTRGGAVPTMQRQVISLLVEYAREAGLRSDFLESEPVMMHVLAPVRTLIEKLMIVHHAGSSGSVTEQIRLARHYYDIWCLLSDHDTIAALEESPADLLAREVSTFADAAGLDGTTRPSDGFAASPALDLTTTRSVRTAFESVVLDQLVWPQAPRPTFEDCCRVVRSHADLL